MRAKRAIIIGVLAWMLIFIEWSIIMFAPVLKDIGRWQWLIHYIILLVIAIYCASLYYKRKDKLNGFVLGMVFLLVGTILDLIITVPLFIDGGYIAYYSNYLLWIGFAEFVIITWIYGRLRR